MNRKNTVLYIGSTVDLVKRMEEHLTRAFPKSFTAKYSVDKLVYFEILESIEEAEIREKQLKNWRREWKLDLIKLNNPLFKDLYPIVLKEWGYE